jgi:hypothetical protein
MRSRIYFSSETQPFSDEDLEKLHGQCIKGNSGLAITGMLLYKGNKFLQVIEGPDQAVEDLFSIIKADPRHKDVVQVVDRPIEHREFQKWEMGFKNLDHLSTENVPGLAGLPNPFGNDHFRKETDRAHQLLLYFASLGG